ncbi:chromosome partitioning protein, ParB family [Alkalispirochaeta americana]|uniref:Chromosome partitioning protein, ParB family n=1 Tax=Alkalispirochaeta americana TaxID=159291 RepID=A0A1N6QTX0_9SPIO|nr:ParB N-terminal domain-containing protein [Alkalispirochaeta americana]SIQ20070.1 chromosome partitioning protein, ParB family [Alkalispirochaeta americana]
MKNREVKEISISSIRTKNRTRQDLGNLDSLVASIRKNGLLHPIVVTEDFLLVAGHRRLEAARILGWQTIDCSIISDTSQEELLQIELDENAVRKEFTSDEMADALLRLDRIRNPSGLKRLWRGLCDLASKIWQTMTSPYRRLTNRKDKQTEEREIPPPATGEDPSLE